jgi:hypothetical protein
VVEVTVHTSEIDPAANERLVTDPLEHALLRLHGLNRVHSLSYPEFVAIDLSFDVGNDLDAAQRDVSAVIARVRLPARTTVTVTPINLNETYVVTYALRAPGESMGDLAALAKAKVAPVLRAIPGVLKAEIIGGSTTGANASAYRFDGKAAVAIAVVKSGNANALDVAEASDDAVAAIAASLAPATIERASTQATFIREAARATQEALGLAVLLAILVIWPFLGDWRATTISALAIPTSLLGTAWSCGSCTSTSRRSPCSRWPSWWASSSTTQSSPSRTSCAISKRARRRVKRPCARTRRSAGRWSPRRLTIVAVFLPIGLDGRHARPFFQTLRSHRIGGGALFAAGRPDALSDAGGGLAQAAPVCKAGRRGHANAIRGIAPR